YFEAQRVGEAQREADRRLVEYRQRARQPQANRAHVGVGLVAEAVWAAAEQLRRRRQLAMHLEADDGLPIVPLALFGYRVMARHLWESSSTWAARNMTASPSAGASTCTPIGSPSAPVPNGTLIAGWPARGDGIVHTSERYMASGSSVFAP